MTRPEGLGCLNDEQWQELQGLASLYEKAWQRAGPHTGSVNLEEFLPPPGAPLRAVYLHELIKTDLEIQWRHRQPTDLDDYLRRFPELGSLRDLPDELIYEEYRVRHLHGDRPSLETYRSRFPDQFSGLQRLIRAKSVQAMPAAGPPPPDAVPAEGTEIGHGYVLKRYRGHGQFAQVWEATAPGNVLRAIKILSWPSDRAESKTERQSLELIKGLGNRCLLRPQAFWEWGNRLVIVMDLAEGSLGDRLKQCLKQGLPGIPLRELLGYIKDAAEGLDCLHAHGLIHRDVKPANLLYSHGHALVADCGLARHQPDSSSMQGSVAGTFAYMAFEAMQGRVLPANDLFSLAVTYAELRGGQQLRLPGGEDLWLSAMGGDPDLSEFGQAEQRVIKRALHRNYKLRHKSCTEFVQALEKSLELRPTLPRFVVFLMRMLRLTRARSPGGSDGSTFTDGELTGYTPGALEPSSAKPAAQGAPVALPEGASVVKTLTPPPVRSDPAAPGLPAPHDAAAEAVWAAESAGGLAGTIIPGMTPVEIPLPGKAGPRGSEGKGRVEAKTASHSALTRRLPGRRTQPARAPRLPKVVVLLTVVGATLGGGFLLKTIIRPITDRQPATSTETATSARGESTASQPGESTQRTEGTPTTASTPTTAIDRKVEGEPGGGAAADKKVFPSDKSYRDALKLEAEGKLTDAAKDMVTALTAPDSRQTFADAPARTAALRIFAAATRQLRNAGSWKDPFNGRQNADLVYRWLLRAREIQDVASAEWLPLRANLAIAAWHGTGQTHGSSYQYVEELVKGPDGVKVVAAQLGADAVPFLLAAAESHTEKLPGGLNIAVASYAEVLRLLQASPNRPDEKDLYEQVLQPACQLQVPPTASKALRTEAATVYAEMGRLLDHPVTPSWVKEKNPKQAVIDAFGAAIRLNDSEPRYFIDHGYALSKWLEAPLWNDIQNDADKAQAIFRTQRGMDYYASNGLRAYALLLQGRRQPNREAREGLLREAVAGYEKAISLARADAIGRKDLPSLLTNCGEAYLGLANAIGKGREEKRRALDLAVERANEVVSGSDSFLDKDKAYAGITLGNAVEDYAWLLGEHRADNYKKAAEHFTKAFDDLQLPEVLMNLGRCLAKWAAFGLRGAGEAKARRDKATEARDKLKLALDSGLLPRDKAEASYWLGQAHMVLGQPLEAEAAFRKAKELAEGHDARARIPYTLTWAELQLSVIQKQDPKSAEAGLEEIRKAVRAIEALEPRKAAALTGKSYWLEKSWEAALREYTKYLSSLDDADATCVPLLIGEIDCRLKLNGGRTLEELQAFQPRLDRALELAEADPQISTDGLADACRAAGDIRNKLAAKAYLEQGPTALTLTYRAEAIGRFQRALEVSPEDPNRWGWHMSVGIHNYYLLEAVAPTDGSKARERHDAAKAAFDAAASSLPTQQAGQRDTIKAWEDKLKDAARHHGIP